MKLSTAERFNQSYIPVPESGCWMWTGSWDDWGYGAFYDKKKRHGAHRWGWALYRGAIPSGLIVCHKCDTPACVNPDHLFLGTHNDNVQDMLRKGRQAHGTRDKNLKLTAEIALAIRDYPASLKQTGIAFEISSAAVKAIRKGQSWAKGIAEIEGHDSPTPVHLTKRQINVLASLSRLGGWATPESFGAYVDSHHIATARWLADRDLVDVDGASYRINDAGAILFSKLKPTAAVKIHSTPMSCGWCGKSYMVTPSVLKKGWGHFCSRQCKSFRQHNPLTTTPESNNGR